MNSDQPPKKPAANKNRALPKKRPCRTKRQKKFFDEHDESCRNKNGQQLKGVAARRVSGATIGAAKKAKTTLVASEPKIKKISADDEEAWLEALEKGELDDNGCLPKSRDVTLLTARQKTKLMTATSSSTQRNNAQAAKEEMSAEDRKKREEKNLRRRLQAIKKAEENKRQTIEKLVKVTTGSHHRNGKKFSLSSAERSTKKPPTPMIRYLSNAHQTVLMYPPGFEYPLAASHARSVPPRRLCQVCGVNERKYDCSKSNIALCSLKCYKTNIGYMIRRRVHKCNVTELPAAISPFRDIYCSGRGSILDLTE